MIDDKKYIKRKEIAIICIGLIMLAGAFLCLFGALQMLGYSNLLQDKYMNDPTIPYNEFENATYTISAKEIKDIISDQFWYLGIGAALVGMAYVGVMAIGAVTPNQKELHINNCEYTVNTDEMDITHCPTCGLKLSLLDKK